jgi:crossover junction endodeoxyribonuclease RusA
VNGWEPVIFFTVHGQPLPKARPKFRGGQGAYTPKATVVAERNVLAAFEIAYPDWEPLPRDARLRIDADFYRATRHGVDTDNLLKLVTDALNKRAFVDDEQLIEVRGRRVYGAGDNARTEVRIYRALT